MPTQLPEELEILLRSNINLHMGHQPSFIVVGKRKPGVMGSTEKNPLWVLAPGDGNVFDLGYEGLASRAGKNEYSVERLVTLGVGTVNIDLIKEGERRSHSYIIHQTRGAQCAMDSDMEKIAEVQWADILARMGEIYSER